MTKQKPCRHEDNIPLSGYSILWGVEVLRCQTCGACSYQKWDRAGGKLVGRRRWYKPGERMPEGE